MAHVVAAAAAGIRSSKERQARYQKRIRARSARVGRAALDRDVSSPDDWRRWCHEVSLRPDPNDVATQQVIRCIVGQSTAGRGLFGRLSTDLILEVFLFLGERRFARYRPVAIFNAAAAGDTQLVVQLLKEGCDFIECSKGMTPLMAAAKGGHLDCIAVLARQPGVDINRRHGCSTTALHEAATQGHRSAVTLLLELGASATVLNGELRTPLEAVAYRKGQIEHGPSICGATGRSQHERVVELRSCARVLKKAASKQKSAVCLVM